MAFRTDGSSHSNGIQLELDIVKFINDSYKSGKDVCNIKEIARRELGSLGNIICLHKGGTGTKSDAILVCYNSTGTNNRKYSISIKRKKYENNKPKGTFDVINTTVEKFNNEYHIIDSQKVDFVLAWLNSKRSVIKTKDDIELIRDEFADLCDMLLEDTVKDADKFIELTKKEFFKTDILVVGKSIEVGSEEVLVEVFVSKEDEIKLFDQEDLKNNKYYLEKGRGKSSRTLMVKTSDGREYKTPFRVRLVLNNGLSAYYGLSDANNTSILTIKIQVDGVQYIVNQMNGYKLN